MKTRKSYEVFWSPADKNAYVDWAGTTSVGKAVADEVASRKAKDQVDKAFAP